MLSENENSREESVKQVGKQEAGAGERGGSKRVEEEVSGLHKCQYCAKHYSSSHSLRTHEKWHRGDLGHPCSHCDKKFRNPSEVRRHEMTHTGEKPHKCPHCPTKFIQKASLRDHVEKKHPTETPPPTYASATPSFTPSLMLNCKYCQRQFSDPRALAEHEESELKEFEFLHQTMEQVELGGMSEIGLQEYLPSSQKDYLPHLLLPPPIQPCIADLQMKTENMSPLYTGNNNVLAKQGKEQVEEEEVISQFFEELEGQYPHLRGELGQELELGRMLNSDTDSSSSLSELGKVLSDTDSSSLCSSSPRHSATPVDTIPASNLTHPRYQAPISTDAVPVIHITPLPNQLNPTTDSGSSLTYQDDLNNFCEGILSQLGTSAWAEELNLGPDLGEPSNSSGQEVVYRTITLPTHTAIPQQQQQSHVSTFSQSKLVHHQAPLSNFPVPSACPWMTDKANLPTGWRTRMVDVLVGSRKIKRAEFLSPNGQHFPSRKTAVDHMIRTAAYSNEDLECMKRGLRTKTQFEWESGRPGVPDGWMTREKLSSDGKVRVFYLSPGGISFPCRQAALDHMAADGKYSHEAVEMMRIGIGVKRSRGQGEFVLGDTSLPPGWKVRLGAGGRETFRCPRGVFHPSRTAVLETLEREGAPKKSGGVGEGKPGTGEKEKEETSW